MCTLDTKHTLSRKQKKHTPSARITDHHHDDEHSSWSRRSFMQSLGLVGGGTIAMGGTNLTASAASPLAAALSASESEDRVIVLVRLKGGNDGLNTIVPIYDYDTYATKRPTIRHNQNTIYGLNANFGIPQSMEKMIDLWGDGKMKVVHGVGYNNQDLSHFVSADNWATTDIVNERRTGFMGRYFENIYPDFLINPPEIPAAIQIGSQGNLLFEGDDTSYAFTVANAGQLESVATTGLLHDVLDVPGCTYGEQLQFMRAMTNTTFKYTGIINQAYTNSTNAVEYGSGPLAEQLALVARMIKGGLGTKVYMVTLDGFDTHADQVSLHDANMRDLSESMSLFYQDLAATGVDQNVVSMTFSEFGRRIEENGSFGTDHGAASPVMLFGPALEGNGFRGQHPDLNDPDETGNLKHSIDFRRLYATLLRDWLCVDATLTQEVLLGGDFSSVNLGFECSGETLGTTDFNSSQNFQHFSTISNGETFLEFTMKQTAKVTVTLFNIVGQNMGTLANEMMFEGHKKINIRESLQKRLFTGQYIYDIQFAGQRYSKSILVR